MATTTAGQTCVINLGFYCNGQRFQYVFRWGVTGGGAIVPLSAYLDFKARIITDILPIWKLAMSNSVEFTGWQCEPLFAGAIIPYRENFPAGIHNGSLAAEVYSQNVSMLTVGWSADQIATGFRLSTSKTFLGPPPEAKCDTQILQAAYINTLLDPLAAKLFEPWTGATTGRQYKRVFGKLSAPVILSGDIQYPVTDWDVRDTVFTQKRRLTAII